MNVTPNGVGRTLPHSIEAEENLISCLLLDGAAVLPRCIAANLAPESFYVASHGIIFRTALALHARGEPCEIAVTAEELKATGQLDAIGGFPFLTQISSRIPTTAEAGYFIEKVRDYAARRATARVISEAVERVHNVGESTGEIVASLRAQLEGIEDAAHPQTKRGFTVWTIDDFEKYDPPADDALMGEDGGSIYWRDRDLALLLGPGGVGKSRLLLQLALAQILGREFVGFQMKGAPRRWLVVGNENSARRYRDELRLMLRDCTPDEHRTVEANLFAQALVDDSSDSLSLDDPKAVKLWHETAAIIRPDVLAVDPWEAVIPGSDCNDAVATREGVRALRAIFNPHSERFTPLIVHHAREGAEAARQAEGWNAGAFTKGSKTLRSIARFGINIAPEDPDDGGRVVLACGKINNAQKFATRGAIMDEATHLYARNPAFDVEAWRADVEGKRGGKSCAIRDVVEAVRAGNHSTGKLVEAVHDSTGASERSIKRRLSEAVEQKYLVPTHPRGNYTLGSKKL